MLYATTRDQNEVFTAHRALHAECVPSGGLFVPFRLPVWEQEAMRALPENSFGQNVAQVLNSFFSTGITAWDVEVAVGRAPVSLVPITSRLTVAECWHNLSWKLEHLVETLADRLRTENIGRAPNSWVRIAVSVAVLFGAFGQLPEAGRVLPENPVDLAVTTGDFTMPMAAWYARAMGLPIGNIICGCNANGGVWDLLHHGQLATGETAVRTTTPEADQAVPRELERLISATLGDAEVSRYLEHCRSGIPYILEADALDRLRRGMFAAVISDSRVASLLHSVYRTNHYALSPYSALAYGSLMDYRARTGESRLAVLIAERSAVCDAAFAAECMDIPQQTLQRLLTRG